MGIEGLVKLIEAITKLLGVLIWPSVALFVLIRFGPALREFVASLGEFSFKGVGFEASAKRKQAEAAAALAAAAASRPETAASPEAAAGEARAAAESDAACGKIYRAMGR